jgi:GNAT superfamily N-acetyltransferase
VRLGVLPGRRGRGFGKELLSRAIQEAKQMGAKILSAAIIDEDEQLKKWYENNGFIESGFKDFEHLPFRVAFMNLSFQSSRRKNGFQNAQT